jgi:3-phosphoshikimate 1-carboxyvinyltransferase
MYRAACDVSFGGSNTIAASGGEGVGALVGDGDLPGEADGLGWATGSAAVAQEATTTALSTTRTALRTLIRSVSIIACPMTPRPIIPFRHPIREIGVRVPASKSITNRELVLSAIAEGRSRLELGPLDPGDDVRAMRQALASLGYRLEWDQTFQVTVHGAGAQLPHATAPVNAAEAGTVGRFALALAALADGETRFDGSERLRERPLTPLVNALRDLGATIDNDTMPLVVRGPLRGGHAAVPGNQSSQFASALLLIGPRMPEGLDLEITGSLVSAPYVDLTIAALERRGAKVDAPTLDHIKIPHQRVKARSQTIPGDATAATYPAAAAAICGGTVTVENVDAHAIHGGQGDVRFFELIEEMGCKVSRGRGRVTVSRVGVLQGIVTNVRDCSDVFPSLAVIATQAGTPTELGGIAHTRLQESDRISAVAAGINALGGRATAFADSIRIEPRPLHEGIVDAKGDHRIAMAFSVLGLQVPGVAIEGAESVSKTFPDFYAMLKELGR